MSSDEKVSKDFCTTLREARAAKGMTQKELAQVTKMLVVYVSGYLKYNSRLLFVYSVKEKS